MHWVIDGNNALGSRPDGWWNDRLAAQTRFAQQVAVWCRTHDDPVTLVFDAPVAEATAQLSGGNLVVVEARHRGRDAADDEIVEIVGRLEDPVLVVTSDRGLRRRLRAGISVTGARTFLEQIGE